MIYITRFYEWILRCVVFGRSKHGIYGRLSHERRNGKKILMMIKADGREELRALCELRAASCDCGMRSLFSNKLSYINQIHTHWICTTFRSFTIHQRHIHTIHQLYIIIYNGRICLETRVFRLKQQKKCNMLCTAELKKNGRKIYWDLQQETCNHCNFTLRLSLK